MPIDLDSIEDVMNRRMHMIWVRYATYLSIFGVIALAGLVVLTVYLTTKATVMKMAVGPKGSKDVEFVQKLEDKFRSERAPIRIQPVVENGPVTLQDIRGKAPFDLAVVRGNMDLSTDWPVVAILRQDVAVLIVPAPAAFAEKKGKRNRHPEKIEKVSELVGKRVGIVEGTDGGPELLSLILKHYGVPADKVKVVNVAPQDLKKAIHDDLIDVVLVAGPETGDAIAQAVQASSAGKQGPSFIEIDQAEGNRQTRSTLRIGGHRGRRVWRRPARARRQTDHAQISDLYRGTQKPERGQDREFCQVSLSGPAVAHLPAARHRRDRVTVDRQGCGNPRASGCLRVSRRQYQGRSSTNTATTSSMGC